MVNKFIKIILTFSVFIASISLFYKFIVEPFRKENKLNRCLERAEELHTKRWNSSCKTLGHKEGCGLDKDTATVHLRVYEKEKEDCYKKYK
ncbi:MAG: hypothetical protein K9L95_01735 [Candidatus Omnitrophica bacterium]|nr:hypothetical protein [Candidatus Omnitrophota bacterium]MCF7878177.1 hypothetical protein [Candidatus Omnitrophota bacterium]MCF7893211.1 hypothetical protein [Candidatus Omnitrophota bacterium]